MSTTCSSLDTPPRAKSGKQSDPIQVNSASKLNAMRDLKQQLLLSHQVIRQLNQQHNREKQYFIKQFKEYRSEVENNIFRSQLYYIQHIGMLFDTEDQSIQNNLYTNANKRQVEAVNIQNLRERNEDLRYQLQMIQMELQIIQQEKLRFENQYYLSLQVIDDLQVQVQKMSDSNLFSVERSASSTYVTQEEQSFSKSTVVTTKNQRGATPVQNIQDSIYIPGQYANIIQSLKQKSREEMLSIHSNFRQFKDVVNNVQTIAVGDECELENIEVHFNERSKDYKLTRNPIVSEQQDHFIKRQLDNLSQDPDIVALQRLKAIKFNYEIDENHPYYISTICLYLSKQEAQNTNLIRKIRNLMSIIDNQESFARKLQVEKQLLVSELKTIEGKNNSLMIQERMETQKAKNDANQFKLSFVQISKENIFLQSEKTKLQNDLLHTIQEKDELTSQVQALQSQTKIFGSNTSSTISSFIQNFSNKFNTLNEQDKLQELIMQNEYKSNMLMTVQQQNKVLQGQSRDMEFQISILKDDIEHLKASYFGQKQSGRISRQKSSFTISEDDSQQLFTQIEMLAQQINQLKDMLEQRNKQYELVENLSNEQSIDIMRKSEQIKVLKRKIQQLSIQTEQIDQQKAILIAAQKEKLNKVENLLKQKDEQINKLTKEQGQLTQQLSQKHVQQYRPPLSKKIPESPLVSGDVVLKPSMSNKPSMQSIQQFPDKTVSYSYSFEYDTKQFLEDNIQLTELMSQVNIEGSKALQINQFLSDIEDIYQQQFVNQGVQTMELGKVFVQDQATMSNLISMEDEAVQLYGGDQGAILQVRQQQHIDQLMERIKVYESASTFESLQTFMQSSDFLKFVEKQNLIDAMVAMMKEEVYSQRLLIIRKNYQLKEALKFDAEKYKWIIEEKAGEISKKHFVVIDELNMKVIDRNNKILLLEIELKQMKDTHKKQHSQMKTLIDCNVEYLLFINSERSQTLDLKISRLNQLVNSLLDRFKGQYRQCKELQNLNYILKGICNDLGKRTEQIEQQNDRLNDHIEMLDTKNANISKLFAQPIQQKLDEQPTINDKSIDLPKQIVVRKLVDIQAQSKMSILLDQIPEKELENVEGLKMLSHNLKSSMMLATQEYDEDRCSDDFVFDEAAQLIAAPLINDQSLQQIEQLSQFETENLSISQQTSQPSSLFKDLPAKTCQLATKHVQNQKQQLSDRLAMALESARVQCFDFSEQADFTSTVISDLEAKVFSLMTEVEAQTASANRSQAELKYFQDEMPSKPADVEEIEVQRHKVEGLSAILEKLKRKYDLVAHDFREADGALEFMLGGRATSTRDAHNLKWRIGTRSQLRRYQ